MTATTKRTGYGVDVCLSLAAETDFVGVFAVLCHTNRNFHPFHGQRAIDKPFGVFNFRAKPSKVFLGDRLYGDLTIRKITYSELTGKETVELVSRGVLSYDYAPSGFNNEQDIFNILYNRVDQKYRAEAIKDDAYYAPDIVVSNQNAQKINVLVQGGSFAHSIVHYMRNYGVANVTQVYYNDFGNTGRDPWSEGPEAWEGILAGKDLIILEATEQQIRGGHKTSDMTWAAAAGNGHLGHNAVYDSLYEYLKAHEGEY